MVWIGCVPCCPPWWSCRSPSSGRPGRTATGWRRTGYSWPWVACCPGPAYPACHPSCRRRGWCIPRSPSRRRGRRCSRTAAGWTPALVIMSTVPSTRRSCRSSTRASGSAARRPGEYPRRACRGVDPMPVTSTRSFGAPTGTCAYACSPSGNGVPCSAGWASRPSSQGRPSTAWARGSRLRPASTGSSGSCSPRRPATSSSPRGSAGGCPSPPYWTRPRSSPVSISAPATRS